MNKLKIILISNLSKSKGGAFIAALRISKVLKKIYKVKILPANDKNFYNKIKYYIAIILKRLIIGKTKYLNSLNIFSRVSFNEKDYDLLHLNWTGHEIISINKLSKIDKPILWTMHDMWLPNSTEHFLNNPSLKKYTINNLDNNFLKKIIFEKKKNLLKKKNIHLIANSKWLKDFAKKSDLTKYCNVNVIYNPIETNLWKKKNDKKSKKNLNLNINKDYILFGAHGGFSNVRKGGDLFIESLKQLKNISRKIEIIVIGGKINSTETINNFKFHFRKLEENQKIQNMYHSASTLTVCPSRAESLPQFIVETILCENPVVSFDIGGIKEIVKHKINGFIEKPFNTNNFASGIKYCLSDIKKTNLIKARNNVKKLFNEKKILNEYKKIIKTITK